MKKRILVPVDNTPVTQDVIKKLLISGGKSWMPNSYSCMPGMLKSKNWWIVEN